MASLETIKNMLEKPNEDEINFYVKNHDHTFPKKNYPSANHDENAADITDSIPLSSRTQQAPEAN